MQLMPASGTVPVVLSACMLGVLIAIVVTSFKMAGTAMIQTAYKPESNT